MVKPFGIGGFSRDSLEMVSNTVSADGTGWTFEADTSSANDAPVITTQCAPLRGSYVSQTGTPAPNGQRVNLYDPACRDTPPCPVACTCPSPTAVKSPSGFLDYSIPASGNRWYVDGFSAGSAGDKLVALEQCIR